MCLPERVIRQMQALLSQARKMPAWTHVAELAVEVDVPAVPDADPTCEKCVCMHQAKVDWQGLGRVQVLMAALLASSAKTLDVESFELVDRERVGLQRQLDALRSID